MGLAAGTAAGLNAALRVDSNTSMNLAAGAGAGLDANISAQDIVDISMLLADGSGGQGLAANLTVDQLISMNLADGGGGAALVPTLTITNPVTIIGTPQAAQATSVTLPTHAVGDLIILGVWHDGFNVVATTPSAGGTVPAWVDIDPGATGSNCSLRTARFTATATNHTSGTWTGADTMIAIVLRGQAASPVGGHAEDGSVAATSAAPSVTLTKTDGTSVILRFHGHRQAGTWPAAPSGYTRQAAASVDSLGNGLCLNTQDTTTSDGSVDQITGRATSDDYQGATVEILAA